MARLRIVVDTNVWVSYLIRRSGALGRFVSAVQRDCVLLASDASLDELSNTLDRPKFDRYATEGERRSFCADITQVSEIVTIRETVVACRDPRDDKFLELAMNGRADVIVTGDEDFLDLHPWNRIAIITPRAFMTGNW